MIEFKNSEIIDFINADIPSYQRSVLLKSLNSDSSSMEFFDSTGKELTGESNLNQLLLRTGPSIDKTSFWDKIKHEVYLFICTNDKKYKGERNLIGKNFKEIVLIIATAIATTFSVGTGVIVGIVTNVLISIAKINQNAWCELQKANNA